MRTDRTEALMKIARLSETELAWLAGWLEGEGSFVARTHKSGFKMSVSANSCDEDIVRRAYELVGGFMGGPYTVGRLPHWQPTWRWSVASRYTSAALMLRLRPLMGERRTKQIDTALAADAATPRQKAAEHGTRSMYERRCRCASCKRANTTRARVGDERKEDG